MGGFLKGFYKTNDYFFYKILKNENGKFTALDPTGSEYQMKIEYGDFGEADEEVEKRSGGKHYNVKLTINFTDQDIEKDSGDTQKIKFSDLGVIFDEGRKCSIKGFAGIAGLEKITEEEVEKIMNDFDPIEAPPGPYRLQPDKKGRILWFTGAPGMGKSTSAQLLARNHDYVYYEADCFRALKNPYIPLDVDNPSMAQTNQKPLKGPGIEERKSAGKKIQGAWGNFLQGKEYDKEALVEYYRLMATDIAKEKKRIGGGFAVAHVLFTAEIRSAIREVLEPDLIIIMLTMPRAERRERILRRHQGDVQSADLFDHFENRMEGVQENEPNTIEIKVDGAMTKDEVVAEVIERVEKLTS